MAEDRLPLLRGRITSVDTYQAPQPGRGKPPRLPSLDPQAHRAKLLLQLDDIKAQVAARPAGSRDALASRELIAVHPAPDTQLAPEQLDHSRDAWLVGTVLETGVVLLDAVSPNLEYLRAKIDAFGDDSKSKPKTNQDGSPKLDANGVQLVARGSENAVAPIARISLASLADLPGQVRQQELAADRAYWFELACSGGYRRAPALTENSRAQIGRQLHRMGVPSQFDEFSGPEQVYFFLRATPGQLEELRVSTDCIYDAQRAPLPIRDLKLIDSVTTRDVKTFSLTPPAPDAPCIVILDTGIATAHPLLQAALLPATVAGPQIPSPEDTHGHGTQMAGLALHADLGAAVEHGSAAAPHWIQSSRILVRPRSGTAAAENEEMWPVLTRDAILAAESADPMARDRVFALAVARSMQDPPFAEPEPTLWSHAVDQSAYNSGQGRLLIVSAGNARESERLALAEKYPRSQLGEKIHEPAQASNALTVGAYTEKTHLPPGALYAEYRAVAPQGGISPFTSTGPVGKDWPIKPDVVMEGGNLAVSTKLIDAGIETLSSLTTQRSYIGGRPLTTINMTSEATARAARLAARIWADEPKLRPETVRSLIVHSASWTPTMVEQFRDTRERLQACGYGVPDQRIASACALGLATVVVEDVMPNGVLEQEPKKKKPKLATTSDTEPKLRRKVKLYRLPIPDNLLPDTDEDAELRVTLSYFAEPNKFGRQTFHGLDLKWDMQGPQESEDEFLQRINILKRPKGPSGKPLPISAKKSFTWDIGPQLRGRGTVQSDRWRGKMSSVVGNKLIAVIPVLGWWERRREFELRTQELRFSLVVSLFGPAVYAAIKPLVQAQAGIIEV